jgi:hypothetical protein
MYKFLIDKKLSGQFVARGHEQAAKYSWEKMVKETLAVYQQVIL